MADKDGVLRDQKTYAKHAKTILNTFNRYQVTEYNTTVARSRTAKQWTDFQQPDNMFLFPNLRWIASRSANPREEHEQFWGLVLPKTDPFWNINQPGNLYNCKCDWEETDDGPVNPHNADTTHAIASKGLEDNPGETGEVFGKNAPYFRGASPEVSKEAIKTGRSVIRKTEENVNMTFDTPIGDVLFDKISVIEISKGAKTDKSYFYKQEIARRFDKYAQELVPDKDNPEEAIDLTHNKSSSPFYQRKRMFTTMKVYKLKIKDYEYKIKLGMFRDGKLNLYSITEYE